MTRIPAPVSKLSGTVSTDTARLGTRDNLDKAGEQFEAIFTRMMLGSMRKAKLADSLFESQALDQFRDMQDQKLAENMAAHTPIGIGKAMTQFLAKAGGMETNPLPPGGGVSLGLTEGADARTTVGDSSPSVALRAPPPPGEGGLSVEGEPK